MSKKTTLISVTAAGATLALVGLAAFRRSRRSQQMLPQGTRRRRITIPRPLRTEPYELGAPDVVLPLAFWDAAAELDTEDELPRAAHALGAADEAYDSIDIEDASATWLARATQSPAGGPGTNEIDDPAEIAADSMSMVSEASRLAAGVDPSGFEDSPPSQRG